jgi:hypothetical protein
MKINTYRCDTCRKQIVVAHVDEGVTPMFLLCRATPLCPGRMTSAMYRCDQTLEPTHEWYKPTKLPPKGSVMRQHVQMGGLLLREKAK